ncbi:MAG: XrtB/PEP-CTERM-associated polysaccharide biosynthesis outer membrane protein EpsL [Burkholderiales bacterium]
MSTSAALLFTWTPTSMALGETDAFKISGGYALQHDSNLFRLPSNVNASSLTGRPERDEWIGVASVGLAFKKDYSLQQVALSLNVLDYHYRHFSYLDFTAINYNAAWRWSLTPRLTGVASTERIETLNSFADFQNTNQRNQRTDINSLFDAEYALDGSWRLLGGVARATQSNELPLVGESDTRSNSAKAGVRYVFPSNSSLAYVYKHTSGRYLDRLLPSSGFFDDRFSQDDHEVALKWLFSGKSSAEIRAAYIQRDHPTYAQRDYDGLVASGSLNWGWSDKLLLSIGAVQELTSYQTENSNYSQTQRFFINPVWRVSPKTTLRFRHDWARIDYRGQPTLLPTTDRADKTNATLLGLEWRVARPVLLSASIQQQRRSSNTAGLAFRSTQGLLSAQFSY